LDGAPCAVAQVVRSPPMHAQAVMQPIPCPQVLRSARLAMARLEAPFLLTAFPCSENTPSREIQW